jgi:hypothetical protein
MVKQMVLFVKKNLDEMANTVETLDKPPEINFGTLKTQETTTKLKP